MNPYRELEVPPDASADDIRRAFRKMALRYHPDKNKHPEASKKFARIVQAYDTLRDPALRAEHDRVSGARMRQIQNADYIPPPPPSTPPPRWHRPGAAADQVARLAALYSRGRFREAEDLATDILEEFPGEALPYAVLADISKSRGEFNHAVNLYARAVQADPKNLTYQAKYEELLTRSIPTVRISKADSQPIPTPFLISMAVALFAGAYISLSREPALMPPPSAFSKWTVGAMVMLFIIGLSLGIGLALGKMVERFRMVATTSTGRIAPTIAISLIALVNFWLAGLVYLILGTTQNSMSPSLNKVMTSALGGTCLGVLFATASPLLDGLQMFLWGGNLVYLGVIAGWLAVDSFG